MTRPLAAFGARTEFADWRAGSGRALTDSSRPQRKPRQRSGIGTGGNALPALIILNVLEQTQAIIGTVEGRIVHWSQGAERLYGWTMEEAVGRRPRELLKQKRADGSEPSTTGPECGGIWNGEFRRAHKDGRELTIAARRVSRCDYDGRAVVIELDDLVERAERYAPPDPARPESSQSDRSGADGCPTRRIVHEFNNLLGIITLNLELARERAAAGSEVREMIEEALDAAWQGSELTGRLSDLTRRRPAQTGATDGR